jgi:hypothetical protein
MGLIRGVPDSIDKTIVVVGNSGELSFEALTWCKGLSIISPDDTPLYDFDLFDSAGQLLISARGIDVQYAKIDGQYKLEGVCRAVISAAADPGNYRVKFFSL